jgi:hypothetical protein
MVKRRSTTQTEIPLYLVPQAVHRQIRDWGAGVYRISVVRTHWHHYNVTVRTRSPARELMPRTRAEPPAAGPEDSARRTLVRGKGRGCAV